MPLRNKQPFKPDPIPQNLNPDDRVFYLDLTNEIFTNHDAFMDRYLICNSLIWTCGRTGKSGLTYKEALDSEQSQGTAKRKKKSVKRPAPSSDGETPVDTSKPEPPSTPQKDSSLTNGDESTAANVGENGQPVKKKKKKYPYDPKKYSMPVPDGFDPSLLTPTGKIDGRKLKSKKNKSLAEELLSTSNYVEKPSTPGKKGKKSKAKEEEAKKHEDEAKRKEDEARRKAEKQAALAKERELEAKRKKEAAALAKQLERQKKDEERKRAAAFLANWEKKCEDLERDDLRRLPQPTPVSCDIPEKLFGDSIFIMEAVYNLHDLYDFQQIYPEGAMSFDTLEEILLDKQEDGALGTLIQFLLKTIFFTQPTKDGYGLDDDSTIQKPTTVDENNKPSVDVKSEPHEAEQNDFNETHDMGSEHDDEDDENEDKYVNMNDLIGSAIKAAQEVKKSLSKPLPEMELDSSNVTEILRLHLLQSGSFPKGRTIYNGWYSSREDPGLWLCMQEPDLIKKLGEGTIYDLEIDERIKILHTLIYQLLTFIKSRAYMEMASDQLVELRKAYRKEAADFARWDRENCVKRMQAPKRKNDPNNCSSDKPNNHQPNLQQHEHDITVKVEHHHQNGGSLLGDEHDDEMMSLHQVNNNERDLADDNLQLKSCLKSNGTSNGDRTDNNDEQQQQSGQQTGKKKISFKTSNGCGAIMDEHVSGNGLNGDNDAQPHDQDDIDMMKPASDDMLNSGNETFEELERAYQQNIVDYEDYQRERAIKHEQLQQTLLDLRINLRNNQSVYAIHPVGRDRAYRRYWLFQSLPGLFVEQEDEFVGKCLPQPTPLESRYKQLFGKENPLMHSNEADLIRAKTCDVACSTDPQEEDETKSIKREPQQGEETADENVKLEKKGHTDDGHNRDQNDGEGEGDNHVKLEQHYDEPENPNSDTPNHTNGGSDNQHLDEDAQHDHQMELESLITDEMNYCTGDEETCYIHGKRRPQQPKWWFYHQPETIDQLAESLNRRGYRESELHDVLSSEISIIKPRVAECPAYKLNKLIMEQSGIRRSRRLKTKGSKRRGHRARNYDD